MGQEQSKYKNITTANLRSSIVAKAASINDLHASCRIPDAKYNMFEYNDDIDLQALKAFFNARIAVALFNKKHVDFGISHSYCTTPEQLEDVIKGYYNVAIIIFGDSEVENEVVKMLNVANDKNKQRLKNELNKPPPYVKEV